MFYQLWKEDLRGGEVKRLYLMRHSTPLRLDVPTEDLPLSEEGRALALEKRAVFKNVGKCYSSPYKRAYETAGLIKDEYEIVEGLHERIIGEEEEGLWLKQYQDYDYKAMGGESLKQVRLRMAAALTQILDAMQDGDEVIVVSHATAICSYLLNYCDIEVTEPERKLRKISFCNQVVLDGKFFPTAYFILDFEQKELRNICFSA